MNYVLGPLSFIAWGLSMWALFHYGLGYGRQQ